MSGRYGLLLFAVLVAAQLAVPAWMIRDRERVLQQGEAYRFRTAPVDPYDAFRGRYVALSYVVSQEPLEVSLELLKGQRVFVTLERDAEGFTRLGTVSLEAPSDAPCIRARVRWSTNGKVHLNLPFDRYYLNEDMAPEAETVYRQANRESEHDAWATVRVLGGRAVLEELYVEGQPIVDFVRDAARAEGG